MTEETSKSFIRTVVIEVITLCLSQISELNLIHFSFEKAIEEEATEYLLANYADFVFHQIASLVIEESVYDVLINCFDEVSILHPPAIPLREKSKQLRTDFLEKEKKNDLRFLLPPPPIAPSDISQSSASSLIISRPPSSRAGSASLPLNQQIAQLFVRNLFSSLIPS